MTVSAAGPGYHATFSGHVSADPEPDMPRVLVSGSRYLTAPGLVHHALTQAWRLIGRPILVVHGANPRGADAHAASWCAEHAFAGIREEPWPADWAAWGRAAGPIRNGAMVKAGAVRLLAFPMGPSRGTRDCIRQAQLSGIPVSVYPATEAAPR